MTESHYQDSSISLSLAATIRQYLEDNQLSHNIPSISYEVLAMQLLDSLSDTANLKVLAEKLTSAESLDTDDNTVTNPHSPQFDPIKALLTLKNHNDDEAYWLSFLLIYTDDSPQSDWAFMRLLYSGLGLSGVDKLSWQFVNESPDLLQQQLQRVADALAEHQPKPKFGHHRAYESFNHLSTVLSSYIQLINEQGGHQALFNPVVYGSSKRSIIDQHAAFENLYSLIRQNVYRFGRLSTFEFLCLLGTSELADIAPDSCYIAEASGPKRGAKLLFGMLSNTQLDHHACELAQYLDVGYQEMEAALCHWQKSPNRYIKHNG